MHTPRVHFAITGRSLDESRAIQLTRELIVSTDRCWLCGRRFAEVNRADEDHIFNRWLQRWLDLWNESIILSNGTRFRFTKARIGTCRPCNEDLSRIEGRLSRAARKGFDAFAAQSAEDILLWLGKMHYGLLRLELRLPKDQAVPGSDAIRRPDFFEGPLKLQHLLLQAARAVVRADPLPGSILLFEIVDDSGAKRFEYFDHALPMFVAVKMGSIGVIATFQDWGWLRETWDQLSAPSAISSQPAVVPPFGSKLRPNEFFDVTTTALHLARSLTRILR